MTKKLTFLLWSLMLLLGSAQAQTVLFSENFDTLTAGSGIVAQSGFPWGTWSGAIGSEDCLVSSTYASSGTQSLHIQGGKDIVLMLSNLTTGRYKLEFDLYVTANNLAYFNLLSDFNGSNSEWATQSYFLPDQTGVIDGDGGAAASFNYLADSWMPVYYIIDLDDDFASFFVNNTEVWSWKYSRSTFGTEGLLALDALNFYGWSEGTYVSDFYIDNIAFSEMTAPEATANFSANFITPNLELSWDAPTGSTPDSYLLTRNERWYLNNILNTQFIENNPYPNTYSFQVRAHYPGEGYSHASTAASVTVPGGIERDLVLMEIHTGTWCVYCPGAAMGADEVKENNLDMAIIKYHNGDEYVNADASIRETYYNVGAFPTSRVDGVHLYEGGSSTESLYPAYEEFYLGRIDYPAVVSMDIIASHVEGSLFTVEITLQEENPWFGSGLILHTALTESHIPENWFNQTEVNSVCRKMYPDGNGSTITWDNDQSFTYSFTVDIEGYQLEHCELVAFVQHDGSKEILQTNKIILSSLVSIKDQNETYLSVYPNPADTKLIIDIQSPLADDYQIEIIDLQGKSVLKSSAPAANLVSKHLDISSLHSGLYFIKIAQGTQVTMKKFQVL